MIQSGVGRAMQMQVESLTKNNIEVTTNTKDAYDIIHINTIFPGDYLMSKRAKRQGKAVVYHAHSTKEDFQNSFVGSNLIAPLFKSWIKKCYSTGDLILTPTEYSKGLLEEYGITKPIRSISNGVDTNLFYPDAEAGKAFRKKYGYGADEKIVMSVGLFFERKGILDFVEIAKHMPQYQFIWFGHTNPALIPRKIRKALRTELPNLKFAGYVTKDELRGAYSGADLFFFPSYEETEGIVVLEALATKIPVLLRSIPVYDKWLENGLQVYKAKDNEQFSAYISGILEGKLCRLTEAGYQVAKSRDLQKQADLLKHYYESVCRNTENYGN